jgi:hypothetical protein
MPDTSLSTTVNPHVLTQLMALAAGGVVGTTADVVDDAGTLLIARGTRLVGAHREVLQGRRLTRPLEACLMAPAGVDTGAILGVAKRILDTSAPMRLIVHASGAGPSPLALLAELQFGAPLRVLMTLASHADAAVLEHSVTVSLLAICMAKQLKLLPDEQRCAGLAGLLHDIGELYIDPAWLAPGRRLLPHEWAHRIAHPRIGQMLVNDLDTYPLAVGRAIAEHHERFDGTGYPRQTMGNHVSAVGQAVSVAEMLAGVLHQDHALARAELALKIVAGEHPHALVSAISGARRAHEAAVESTDARVNAPAPADTRAGAEDVVRLYWRIVSALEMGENLQSGSTASSPRARVLLARTLERVQAVQRAFISTGLDVYLDQQHTLHASDATLLFEKNVATREIQWRLRDLARDLALHTGASPDERSVFAGLINLLDDDSATHLNRKPAPTAAPALAPLMPTSFAGSQPYGA